MVTRQQCWVSVLLAVAGLCGGAAFAQTTVGGIRFEPEVNLSGQKLKLNGAGIRYRAIFKVYVAGLYQLSGAR
jgi:Chalcone isomerase-like